ncbi:hypothetical protein [Desulfonema magnum]|nr:hypothetical protein [Desulfonema magnum]
MEKEIIPDIQKKISDVLKKSEKDYLTITQIRTGLPTALLKYLELTKNSGPADVLKKLRPYIKGDIREYKGAKTSYIGFNMPLKEIIFNKICQKSGSSSAGKLAQYLPMLKKDYISNLNQLLEEGRVLCALNETYKPFLTISSEIKRPEQIQAAPRKEPSDESAAFKTAYDMVGKGRSFVRIHRIREHLNWPKEHFDRVLRYLRRNYVIQLQGGDPSLMTDQEINDSFIDENGIFYVTVTWKGKNDGQH